MRSSNKKSKKYKSLKNKSFKNVEPMNNSKKLDISKNDNPTKLGMSSKNKKTEKISVILQRIFASNSDFNESDMEAYWSHFELSPSEQERIFSDEIHPDDVQLLWDYVIVNFFRIKVLGEQEHYIEETFFEKKEGTNINHQNARTEGLKYIKTKDTKKKAKERIKEKIIKEKENTRNTNQLIDLENKKLEYFWKIELEAIGRSIPTRLYHNSSVPFDNVKDRKLDSTQVKPNDKEAIFIHRLSLLYRSIYSLLTQDTLFERVLSSESVEIIPSGISLDSIEGYESEKMKNTARSFARNFIKSPTDIEVQLHKKFFALCFFVSYAQLQDMWRSLIIGYQLNLARKNAELFIECFNLYTDSVSAVLGKTVMLFSSAQQEKALFEPRKAALYNKVFTQLYKCIDQRNPSFLSFTPHEQLSIIDRAEIFWVESLRTKLKYTERTSDNDINEDINKDPLKEQNTKFQQDTLEEQVERIQKTFPKESVESLEYESQLMEPFVSRSMNYDVDEFEDPVMEMKTSLLCIRMTLYESFTDYFQHMVSPEEKFSYQNSSDSLQNREEHQGTNKKELCTDKFKHQAEKLNNGINFKEVLERAKRQSFQLYNWSAWSKIEKYSIDTFLRPQLFERKVMAEATTNVSATQILPCHLLFTTEELEITLLIYQQRLLLQIIAEVSDIEVRVDRSKLSSFKVPPEYMGLGFLWYELPKKPPKYINVLYKTQPPFNSKAKMNGSRVQNNVESNSLVQEILLQLQSDD